MSLENKIEELTEAVTTLTGALATLTTQMLGAKGAAAEVSVELTDTISQDENGETPAQLKKREAKEKRDTKRQAAQEKETADAKAAEEAGDGLDEEPEVVTIGDIRLVAKALIAAGKKTEWLAALKATGAEKLSAVEDFAALMVVIKKL